MVRFGPLCRFSYFHKVQQSKIHSNYKSVFLCFIDFSTVVKLLLFLRGLWDHSDINSKELCMYSERELFQIVAGLSPKGKGVSLLLYLAIFPKNFMEIKEIALRGERGEGPQGQIMGLVPHAVWIILDLPLHLKVLKLDPEIKWYIVILVDRGKAGQVIDFVSGGVTSPLS